jgi:putative PIN family toxin of toxin-antitoxin system
MRAVLDTNVLISALAFPGSKPDQILDRVRRHELQLIVSPFILEETRRILVRKLGLGQATAAALIRTLSNLAEMVHPAKRLHLVTAKDDDYRVLECAIQSVGRARIVSPADFLSILEPPRKAT